MNMISKERIDNVLKKSGKTGEPKKGEKNE